MPARPVIRRTPGPRATAKSRNYYNLAALLRVAPRPLQDPLRTPRPLPNISAPTRNLQDDRSAPTTALSCRIFRHQRTT
eukprot:8517191-Alexandrium_andersonii.AAC.1